MKFKSISEHLGGDSEFFMNIIPRKNVLNKIDVNAVGSSQLYCWHCRFRIQQHSGIVSRRLSWVIPDIRYNFGDEMTRKKIHLLKFLSLYRYVPHIPP